MRCRQSFSWLNFKLTSLWLAPIVLSIFLHASCPKQQHGICRDANLQTFQGGRQCLTGSEIARFGREILKIALAKYDYEGGGGGGGLAIRLNSLDKYHTVRKWVSVYNTLFPVLRE